MTEAMEKRLEEALGYIRNQRQQIEQLRQRITQLESVLDHCLGDPDGMWLWRNRVERMDPLVPVFDPLRARFHLARYEFASPYASGRKTVDVACGTGYGCRVLAEQGKALSVRGFDVSAEAVQYAGRRYRSDRVSFAVASAAELPLDTGEAGLLTSFETIEHVAEDQPVVDEFARVLEPGGILVISTPNQWPLEIAPCHVRVYSLDSFRRLLETRFEVLEIHNQNSGSAWEYNHGQPAGMVPTDAGNQRLAECFVAVCRKKSGP